MNSSSSPHLPGRPSVARLHHAALLLILALGSVASAALLYDVMQSRGYVESALPGPRDLHAVALGCAAVLGGAATLRLYKEWRSGRWTNASGAPFRWGFVVGVATVIVHVCIQTVPYFPLSAAVLLAEGFGVYALFLHFAPTLARRVSARFAKAADVVAFNLALLPLSAEILLRVWDRVHPSPLLDRGQLESDVWVNDFRLPPGHMHIGFPINRRGYYDSDPPTGADRGPLVASIGDSFSASIVPLPFHFTSVAEETMPGVEVYNIGIARADPVHYLSMLESEALPLRPDLILINYFVGNDLVLRKRVGYEAGGLKSWFDRNGFALYVFVSRWRILRQEAASLGVETRLVGDVDAGSIDFTSMTKEQILARARWLADPLLEKPSMSEATFMEIETAQARRICLPPAPGAVLDYSVSLGTLAALLETAGEIPLVVMLIPDEFQVEDALWAHVVRAEGSQSLSRFLPQEVLRNWLDARGVPYLDLLPILRAEAPLADGDRHLYHRFNTHFNVHGNQVAGRALAPFLTEQLSKKR